MLEYAGPGPLQGRLLQGPSVIGSDASSYCSLGGIHSSSRPAGLTPGRRPKVTISSKKLAHVFKAQSVQVLGDLGL